MLLPYAVLLGLSGLLQPELAALDARDSQLSQLLIGSVKDPMVQHAISIFLIFIQASIINRMVILHKISAMLTLLPGMFYIMMVSFFPSFLGLSDNLIANTFVILALTRMMVFYQKNHMVSQIYLSGLLLGISIILVPQYLPLLIFGIFAVIFFNALNIKIIMQIIGGIFTTIFAYFQLLFLNNFDIFHEFSKLSLSLNNLTATEVLRQPEMLLIAIPLVISILGFNNYGRKKSVSAQKKIDLLFYLLLFSLVVVGLCNETRIEYIYLAFVPLSIFVSMSFLSIRNIAIAEMINFVLLAVLALLHLGIIPS